VEAVALKTMAANPATAAAAKYQRSLVSSNRRLSSSRSKCGRRLLGLFLLTGGSVLDKK
jgi:hypothetical protein